MVDFPFELWSASLLSVDIPLRFFLMGEVRFVSWGRGAEFIFWHGIPALRSVDSQRRYLFMRNYDKNAEVDARC